MHFRVVQHRFEPPREIRVRPFVAVHLEAMAGFLDAGGVVVTVPDVGHDDGGLAEIQALGETVVAAVVDHRVDLWNDRGLRVPAGDMDVRWHVGIFAFVFLHVDQRTIGQFGQDLDDPLEQRSVTGTQTAEADIEKGLVVVGLEMRDGVLLVLSDTALEVLKPFRIERMAALELHRLRVEQEVEMG